MNRHFTGMGILGLLIGMCLSVLGPSRISFAKDLPILVGLSEIGEPFDKKRVSIFGWVRSAEVKTGRRGSLHLELIVGEGENEIKVFSIRPVQNVLDHEVIVQGIYHQHGRFAGFEQNHFIVADTIVENRQSTEQK